MSGMPITTINSPGTEPTSGRLHKYRNSHPLAKKEKRKEEKRAKQQNKIRPCTRIVEKQQKKRERGKE
jgi:hypothetical protein